MPSAEAYYGFVTMIFLLFGAVMEFPIVLVLLAKLGILSVEQAQVQPQDGHPGRRRCSRSWPPRAATPSARS